MTFANPYYLLGLAAAGLPVVIHLLTRDRVRRVAFSTLRFFVKGSQRVLRRKKFQEAVLLATRCLAVALAVVALSRPIRADDQDGPVARAETARAILLDTSASMGAGRFDRAQAQAREALEELREGDDAACLLTFDVHPAVRADWANRFDDVRARLELVRPSDGGTDLPAALRKAAAMVQAVGADRKEIVLVSDLQRTGWRSFAGDWSLPEGVELTIRPVPPPPSGNAAITDATVPSSLVFDAAPRTVACRVSNYASEPVDNAVVSLVVAGETVDSRRLNVPAGGDAAVRFRHVFARPGDNPGELRIDVDDAVAGDDVYYFNARVIPKIRVVLVNGRPTGRIETDAGLALGLALSLPLVEGAESALDVTARRAGELRPDEIDEAMVVLLADVGSLPDEAVAALQRLLDRGGGVLHLPGPSVEAEAFNASLAPVAPCRLRRVVTPRAAVGREGVAHLTRIEFDHPVFREFRRPHHGNLSAVSFGKLWELSDSQLARVIARFDNQRPALLERRMGEGVSMLLASPVGQGFNDLPIAQGPIFVSLVQEIVKHLSVRTEQRSTFLVGDAFPASGPQTTITDPRGQAAGPRAETPGLYELQTPEGQRVLAVNRPFDEADPAVVEPGEIVAAVTSDAAGAEADAAPGDPLLDAPRGRGMGWHLLAALAVLLAGELFLANRTIRH